MQIFSRMLLIFFIPIVLFILSWEIYLRQISTTYSEKEQGLIANQDKIELLILGNSHATYGIDPNQFNLNSYNLAQVNQSLYYDKRITLKFIDKLTKLKFVIISLDFHSLYFSSQGFRDIWSYYEYGIDYKNTLSLSSKYSRVKGFAPKLALSFLERDLSKKYKKINAIDVETGVNLNKPIYKGWFSFEGTNQDGMSLRPIKSRANGFNNLVLNSTEKEDITIDLEDFIHQLQLRNIIPILVTIPCYRAYRIMINEKLLNKNELDISNLAHKFNIQYWNYFNLPFDETDFYNCDHLNGIGASKFSKILNLRIGKLVNLNKPAN